MQIKTLGLDIGISSIGWAIVEEDTESQEIKIIQSGVRIFTKAENPKDKSSLAIPRREARSARRRTRRKRERLLQIKKFLAKTLDLPLEEMFQGDKLALMFQTSKDFSSPWELRVRALYRQLDNAELARVILHIAKHRGYDDITYGLEDLEGGKIKKFIAENQKNLEANGYRTIGEMMTKTYFQTPRPNTQPLQWENVRNHPKQGDYKRCIGRKDLRNELEMIFKIQQELGHPKINADFKTKLLGDPNAKTKQDQEGMIFYQRPLKGFEDKIGDCQHIKRACDNPKCACKNAPSAEEFIALTKIINFLMYLKNQLGDVSFDLPTTITMLLDQAKQSKSGLSYVKLKKLLSLPQNYQFAGLDYSKENAENAKFVALESTFKLTKINPHLSTQVQDQIANVLGSNKDWEKITRKLKDLGLSAIEIQNIENAKLSFSNHINLSLEALEEILPLMREGKRYDEAVSILQEKGIFTKPQHQKSNFLPALEELAKNDSYFEIRNPVVNRALSECRKVVNALLQKYGKFHYFNIELTREVGRNKKQREAIEKSQKENQNLNQQALSYMKEIGLVENAKNVLKVKLFLLQQECCLYSGERIKIEHLRDDKMLQIDHAFPLSRSLDDSQSNKVLCFASQNQNKKNQTPYEFLGGNPKEWEAFVQRVYQGTNFSQNKKRKLTNRFFKDRSPDAFLARNLVDTGYIGNVVKEYIKNHLEFLPLPDGKKEHIRVVSGSLTSAMRDYWGLRSKNREHHLHHAQDAIIIACIQPKMIQKYTKYIQEKELLFSKHKGGELQESDYKTKLALRWPMENFKNKVQESILQILVSHRASHKVSGALHQETIRKKEDYFEKFGGEIGVQKAIELGKIREINGGIVDNGEMVRVDVFKSKDKGKFYAVPIYTFDFALGKLPNKAIVQGKKEGVLKDWLEMDENYEFCFSLFKNDCVQIQTKEMQSSVIVVYKGTSTATASMNFEHLSKFTFANIDEEQFFCDKKEPFTREGCGIQNLKVFQKVQVSPLGEIKPCKPARRQEIRLKSSPKNV